MSPKPRSLLVTLRLPSRALAPFPHEPIAASSPPSKPTPPSVDVPTMTADSIPAAAVNGNATTTTTSPSLPPPVAAADKPKPTNGKTPKSSSKRTSSVMEGSPATQPKAPRGKPGPKRKKLGDMLNDPNEKGPFATPASNNKLGPKANMGIINQNLRNLDRTGKKCRRWEKRGFQVRSFTGVIWTASGYQAPPRNASFLDPATSDSAGSSADSKIKDESSAISDSGPNGDGSTPVPSRLNGIASSPAPIAAA